MPNKRFLPFMNPATGEQFGEIVMSGPAEIERAVEEMRQAAVVWREKPVAERVRVLKQLQTMLLDSLDEITAVITRNTGKSRQDALIEVFITVDILHQYCKHAPRWLQRRRVSSGLQIFKRCYVEQRPYGVVAIIAPWNYPFLLALQPVISALLAGNTVVLKPSEKTAATSLLLDQLLARLPDLAPFVRVLHGDGSVGSALVEAVPDLIFVTGSTATGQKILEAAAANLTPVISELGGKDAMLVLEDADIAAAARWGTWGAFYNAGQTCMSVERIYVVAAVYDDFVRAAMSWTQAIEVGFSEEINTRFHLGPLVCSQQTEIVEKHLQDATAKGAQILSGGTRRGLFFEPTVLVNVDDTMLIMREETFGPIMPIMKVADEGEAIRQANNSQYGLGASVWSQDLARAQKVAHQVQAATVLINDTIAHFGIPLAPFGGIKQSGHGRAHGREGLLAFSQPYTYIVGAPPKALDIATIMRTPGHYRLGAAIMRLAFGVTPRQKLTPLVDILPQTPKVQPATRRLAIIGAVIGLAAGVLSLLRGRGG